MLFPGGWVSTPERRIEVLNKHVEVGFLPLRTQDVLSFHMFNNGFSDNQFLA